MKKSLYLLITIAVIATNLAIGLLTPVKADEGLGETQLPSNNNFGDITEAAPQTFDMAYNLDAAEVIACSSGLYDFITSIMNALKSASCAVFSSILGTDIGTKCTVSAGGTDTMQMCREWVQRKEAELSKYLAEIKKILIATYVRKLVDKMAFDVIDWISGKTTGAPQFITNWNDYLWGAAKEAIGDVIQYTGTLSFLCSPFKAQVVLSLPVPQRPPLPICTLDTVVTNIENFYSDFRNGGWLAFNQEIRPENNPYGAWLMEMDSLDFEQAQIMEQKAQEGQSGYEPTKKCLATTTDALTGQTKCTDSVVSIPGSVKSNLTNQATTVQMQKAEQYMITSQDLTNYATLIAQALISRIVKSASEEIIGGQEYGSGLLALPDTGNVATDKYTCEIAEITATCVSDPNGTMTKDECDSMCKADRYSCDQSGSTPTCKADPNGTMTQAECQNSCVGPKYSCIDAYGTKMCATDPNGTYATEKDCNKDCKPDQVFEPPTCASCTGVYVRGRYPVGGSGYNCQGSICSVCTAAAPASACAAFCAETKDNMWGDPGLKSDPATFTKAEMQPYEPLFNQFGYSIPDSCTCKRSMFHPYMESFGMGYTPDEHYYCRNCTLVSTDTTQPSYYFSACTKSDWCDKNCSSTSTTP